MTHILDNFTRGETIERHADVELPRAAWLSQNFALVLEPATPACWKIIHRATGRAFSFYWLAIEPAAQAVLDLEAIGVDWGNDKALTPSIAAKVAPIFARASGPLFNPKQGQSLLAKLLAAL